MACVFRDHAAGHARRALPSSSREPAGASPWRRLLGAVADRRRARRAIREPHRLNDKLLRDMGLDRCGVEFAVHFGRE